MTRNSKARSSDDMLNLSQSFEFTDISSMFTGFGTLLIDGNALVSYVQKANNSSSISSSRKSIQDILFSLKESGFDKIKVVFIDSKAQRAESLFEKDQIYSIDK